MLSELYTLKAIRFYINVKLQYIIIQTSETKNRPLNLNGFPRSSLKKNNGYNSY
jgi:hypothetical protein